MKTIILLFLLISLNCEVYPQEFITLFPSKKVYSTYYADALSHQFSLSKHLESVEWFGNIGNSFVLAGVNILNIPFQVSAAATVFNTVIKTPGHIQVYTVDYLVDFYADFPAGKYFVFRYQLGHLSAHYSDDGIIELGNYPLNYVRDYTALHAQYLIHEINGRIYSGVFFNFHNEPEPADFTFQLGGDAEKKVTEIISFYAALDIKVKSEVNYGSTQSFQTGVKFSGGSRYALRIAYTHRRGFEERGQLFNKKDIKNSLGIYFDF